MAGSCWSPLPAPSPPRAVPPLAGKGVEQNRGTAGGTAWWPTAVGLPGMLADVLFARVRGDVLEDGTRSDTCGRHR